MYNRYIPQPDGTYTRKSVKDPAQSRTARQVPEERTHTHPDPMPPKCPMPEHPHTPEPRKHRPVPRQKNEKSAASFLKALLPRDLDTGDLLIVILLLLMSADCSGEDQGNALLTLALYLFM